MSARTRVVIVGAGFGGLAAARALAGQEVEVTLVDRHNYHTFQPLLYQVATAGLNAADVAHAVRAIFQNQDNLSFRQGDVDGVDWEARHVGVVGGSRLPFDFLVLAAGATTNHFGIPGASEHGFPLYRLADAVRLRNHVLRCFETVDADPAAVDDGALNFVVVGGGPTGVEIAGALTELISMVLRKDFRHLDVSAARVVIVERLDRLLSTFREPSQRHAREVLTARGVELRLGEAVEEVTAGAVRLGSGEELRTRTLIWAAGVRANPLGEHLAVALGRNGRIVVAPDLSVPSHPDAFVVGDLAAIGVGRESRLLPQLAPVATQSGEHAGRQIRRRLEGRPTQPFRYRDKGVMATIGRGAAVADLPLGVTLTGAVGWLAWLGLHLVFLVGFRNRASVLLNWTWNYFTWDRGPRILLEPERPRD
ncbi:MAG: NAD(P)/FAD-dependent oxidoreductase [Acidimicrobiia bacterium]